MTAEAAAAPRPYDGWAVVAATFVVLFFAFGSAYSFGAFFEPLEREFAASRGSVSLVFGLAAFVYFTFGAVSGAASDRYGARWFVAAGMVLVGLGLIMGSRATALWQVYVSYGVGIGFGVGLAYVPSVGAVQKRFVRRRGQASGFAVAGIGVGTLCMPLIARELIAGGGWRDAYFAMGIAAIAGGTVAALFIGGSPGRRGRGDVAAGLRRAVRSRPFVMIYIAFILASFGNFVPFVHLVPYARDHGISSETSVVLLGLIGVGSTLGRFALGGVADRFGRQRTLGCTFAGLGLSCFWWLASDQAWQLGIFALVMGICYGGFVALAPAVMADYYDTGSVAGIIGALYTGVGLGTLAGPTLAGIAFDLWHSYTLPIVASGVAALIGAFCVFRLEPPEIWRHRSAK